MRNKKRRHGPRPPLPQGAEAALWSIVEAVPDPRNHLALTRDMTGEVRIAERDRAEAQVGRCPPARSSRSASA